MWSKEIALTKVGGSVLDRLSQCLWGLSPCVLNLLTVSHRKSILGDAGLRG